MIALYDRLMAAARTENARNRVQIRLGNQMTPTELEELAAHHLGHGRRSLRARVSSRMTAPKDRSPEEQTRVWLTDLVDWTRDAGAPPYATFTRRRLRHGAYLFRGVDAPEASTVLLCFSGNAHRMMLPMPTFLQAIGSRGVDVAWLRSERRRGYRTGIRGVGHDLPSSVDALVPLLGIDRYARVAVAGTSGGGLPAVLAALQLGADAALSVSGNSPRDERWAAEPDQARALDLASRGAIVGARPRITLLHSAGNAIDAASSADLAAALPTAVTVTVPGDDHNALLTLLRRGRLPAFLRSTLLDHGSD